MKKALVIQALMMVINLRKPPAGLIHHSDRGSQYASHDYQKLLQQNNTICSMSRKGNCWDNSPVERFFGSLKREWTGDRLYRTRKEAITDIREYVAVYYNSKRLHSTLGYSTPINYEKTLTKCPELLDHYTVLLRYRQRFCEKMHQCRGRLADKYVALSINPAELVAFDPGNVSVRGMFSNKLLGYPKTLLAYFYLDRSAG